MLKYDSWYKTSLLSTLCTPCYSVSDHRELTHGTDCTYDVHACNANHDVRGVKCGSEVYVVVARSSFLPPSRHFVVILSMCASCMCASQRVFKQQALLMESCVTLHSCPTTGSTVCEPFACWRDFTLTLQKCVFVFRPLSALPCYDALDEPRLSLYIPLSCFTLPPVPRSASPSQYYDNTVFHRVIRKFMVQGGDPTGTGKGGESIYGKPFRDEIHTRIKFNHRGQVAMANENEPGTNHSQFFFTLDNAEHLDKKHTIFGKASFFLVCLFCYWCVGVSVPAACHTSSGHCWGARSVVFDDVMRYVMSTPPPLVLRPQQTITDNRQYDLQRLANGRYRSGQGRPAS